MQNVGDALRDAGIDTRPDITRMVEGLVANEHGKVLVVGADGNNFTHEHRQHPQVIFWEGFSEGFTRDIPKAVRLVLTTRFVRHRVHRRLHDYCRAHNIVFGNEMMGTGQIRSIIEPLMSARRQKLERRVSPQQAPVEVPKEQSTIMTESQTPPRMGRGTLQRFILSNADLSTSKTHTNLARELVAMAATKGIALRENSVAGAIGTLRRRMKKQEAPKAEAASTSKRLKAAVQFDAGRDADRDDELDQVLSLLNDVQAAVDLLRERVQQQAGTLRRVRELQKMLRSL